MHLRRLNALGSMLVGLLFGLFPASTALAQAVTLNTFSPGEIAADDFQLRRPLDQGHLRFGIQVHLDYANSPLVVEASERGNSDEVAEVVGHQLNGTLGLSIGIADRLVLFAGLPVVLWMDGADAARLARYGVGQGHDDAGLGNAYFGGRLRLLGDADDVVALGVQATVVAPAPGDQAYRGSDRWAVAATGLLELRPVSRLRLVVNLGSVWRKRGGVGILRERNDVTYGLGAGLRVLGDPRGTDPHLDLLAQVFGRAQYADLFGVRAFDEMTSMPLELLLGGKYFHRGLMLGAAAGPGITRGVGSPDVRVVGMVAYTEAPPEPRRDADGDGLLDDEDSCPQSPEDMDAFEDDDGCPDPDNDRDRVLDEADACPVVAEDFDQFEDDDGCPDEDNDGDGVVDRVDSCPMVPEDRDGFDDDDGCPDVDNDGDGIVDDSDQCPDQAGPPENHGCPDSDRDGDTVVDRLDNCPDEPGEVQNQGCKKEQQVRLERDRLVILDVVYFATNSDRIQPRSFPLLLNVAAVLEAHPEIRRLRIEGHTDSRGRYARNVELSKQRAAAVKVFLSDRGKIDPERLETEGFGPDRPIVPDAKRAKDHALNRRVEFQIVQR